MRIAFIGVSHFHTHKFMDALTAGKDRKVVGVSDPLSHVADKWATELGADAFTDYRLMCEKTKPDLVAVFGRPDRMAEAAEYVIRAGIPSILEKPVGINVAEIARVKKIADEVGTFATIPFSLRNGLLARTIKERCGSDELTYASFRVLSGLPIRYNEGGVEWNLDPKLCGGGSTLNIGSQYFDLIRYLSPSARWKVKGATMSSQLSGIKVEEYSSVLLESGGRSATMETGYLLPGKGYEVAVSICVGPRVFRIVAPNNFYIREANGQEERLESYLTQSGWYPAFVDETIRRIQTGEPPVATLDDMLEAALLTEAAYRMTGFDDCMKA